MRRRLTATNRSLDIFIIMRAKSINRQEDSRYIQWEQKDIYKERAALINSINYCSSPSSSPSRFVPPPEEDDNSSCFVEEEVAVVAEVIFPEVVNLTRE